MKQRVLVLLLALCGLLAVYPSLVWAVVRLTPLDDRWLSTVAMSAFTIPAALGLAAMILAIHGLRMNAAYRDDVAEELEEMAARQTAAIGAVAGGGVPASVAEEPDGGRTTRTARVARPPASKAERTKRRAGAIARRKMRQSFRF